MLLQMLPRRPGFEANTGEALSTTSHSRCACCWMLLSLVPFTWYPDLQASRSACHLASSTCTINSHTMCYCVRGPIRSPHGLRTVLMINPASVQNHRVRAPVRRSEGMMPGLHPAAVGCWRSPPQYLARPAYETASLSFGSAIKGKVAVFVASWHQLNSSHSII